MDNYKKIPHDYWFDYEDIQISEIGFGLFSMVFQVIGGAIPTLFLKNLLKKFSVFVDKFLLKRLVKNILSLIVKFLWAILYQLLKNNFLNLSSIVAYIKIGKLY